MRVFSVFHKTAQNRPKNIQNAQNEQNTLCAIQRNTVLCVFLSLRKYLQKTFAKHVQNIAKHPQNTAKHRKTLFFEPQNTRKTPQNIAKHHKTDLLTKQTELANKPLRSPAQPPPPPQTRETHSPTAPHNSTQMDCAHPRRRAQAQGQALRHMDAGPPTKGAAARIVPNGTTATARSAPQQSPSQMLGSALASFRPEGRGFIFLLIPCTCAEGS